MKRERLSENEREWDSEIERDPKEEKRERNGMK